MKFRLAAGELRGNPFLIRPGNVAVDAAEQQIAFLKLPALSLAMTFSFRPAMHFTSAIRPARRAVFSWSSRCSFAMLWAAWSKAQAETSVSAGVKASA